MPKSCLLVSKESAEIHAADELEYVDIGEILQEDIPPLIKEQFRQIDPGTWLFVIEGNYKRAREYLIERQMRIFRVVREGGLTVSTGGFSELGLPNGDVFEVKIIASGERIISS